MSRTTQIVLFLVLALAATYVGYTQTLARYTGGPLHLWFPLGALAGLLTDSLLFAIIIALLQNFMFTAVFAFAVRRWRSSLVLIGIGCFYIAAVASCYLLRDG